MNTNYVNGPRQIRINETVNRQQHQEPFYTETLRLLALKSELLLHLQETLGSTVKDKGTLYKNVFYFLHTSYTLQLTRFTVQSSVSNYSSACLQKKTKQRTKARNIVVGATIDSTAVK